MITESWPMPGEHEAIQLTDVPVGSTILGMAPIGVRWLAKKTKKGVKPEGRLPACEFAPCFTEVDGVVREIAQGRAQ